MSLPKQPFVGISDQAYAIITELRAKLKHTSEQHLASMSILTAGKLFKAISTGGYVVVYRPKPPTRNVAIKLLRKLRIVPAYTATKLEINYEFKEKGHNRF